LKQVIHGSKPQGTLHRLAGKLDERSNSPYHQAMTSLNHVSAAQLRRAAAIKERIETLESKLSKLLGGSVPATDPGAPADGRRSLSPSARRKIAAAQRRRWAKSRQSKGGSSAKTAAKRKRVFSAATRAKLSEAARRRWAARRAA